jgi:hypothetical protein
VPVPGFAKVALPAAAIPTTETPAATNDAKGEDFRWMPIEI